MDNEYQHQKKRDKEMQREKNAGEFSMAFSHHTEAETKTKRYTNSATTVWAPHQVRSHIFSNQQRRANRIDYRLLQPYCSSSGIMKFHNSFHSSMRRETCHCNIHHNQFGNQLGTLIQRSFISVWCSQLFRIDYRLDVTWMLGQIADAGTKTP